jgi:hypothetical protein
MGRFSDDLFNRIEQAVDRTIQMALALPSNVAGLGDRQAGNSQRRKRWSQTGGSTGHAHHEGFHAQGELVSSRGAGDVVLDPADRAKRITLGPQVKRTQEGVARDRSDADDHAEKIENARMTFSILHSPFSILNSAAASVFVG